MKLKDEFRRIGIEIPELLLPREDVDLKKWSVIACDQFTSEPEYWENLEKQVGQEPSTLHCIFPEVYLGDNDEKRIENIRESMKKYLNAGLLKSQGERFVLTERHTSFGRTRYGLIIAIDLEAYSFTDQTASIRPTEGTIIERLPPRIRIREKAPLEFPHVLLLIDDNERSVIEPLIQEKKNLPVAYETELFHEGDTLTGYSISSETTLKQILKALQKINDSRSFLFAVGDGNHSLATAKAVWNSIKETDPAAANNIDHPGRYALVELENIYDPGLVFEPIHRVVFDSSMKEYLTLLEQQGTSKITELANPQELKTQLEAADEPACGIVNETSSLLVSFTGTNNKLSVDFVQEGLNQLVEKTGAEVDYIHGFDTTVELGRKSRNFGIVLPNISKESIFETVRTRGKFPRKAFSIGEAEEKRYYMEGRKIIP